MNVQNQPPLPRAPHPRPALTQLVPPFAARPTADRVSLVAPHGAAASTTLRLIAGSLEPNAGQPLLKGQDITGVPPYKCSTISLFPRYALFQPLYRREISILVSV